MNRFSIGGPESGYLNLYVLERSYKSSNYLDDNWLDSRVEILTRSFRGQFNASLRAEELQAFRGELGRLVSSRAQVASFHTTEGQLSIQVIGNHRGNFTATCEAVDRAGIGTRMLFQFSLDQTHLMKMLQELDEILRTYPVIASPS